MRIINIPNIITGLNLVCGSIASIMFLDGDYTTAVYLIILALVLDFLDGFAARILKVSSEVGKQLDSLADMVSFGFFPSIVLYVLLGDLFPDMVYVKYFAFFYTVFSAFRLAKFNLDTRQTVDFIGLATPSGALFILGLFFGIKAHFLGLQHIGGYGVILIELILSFLLISEVSFFGLKLSNLKWKGNEEKYLLLVLSILSFVFFKYNAVFVIISAYIIYNIIKHFLVKK